jgi:hypothetical protein
MSNNFGNYNRSGCGYGGYNENGYGGSGYGNVTISEREKALEREKKEWHVYWTKKEEQCQLKQKRKEKQWQKHQEIFQERGWKWTGELLQSAARLNTREAEIERRERKLAKCEDELRTHEAILEEEKAKVMEQYKRVKRLERQGKRREERIQQAKQGLQHQANEHFSIVYQTLQLGIKSLHHQTSSISVSAPASVPTSELHLSTHQSIPQVKLPPASQVIPFHTAIRPSNNPSSSLFGFGKIKALRSFNSPTPSANVTTLSKRHSPCACTPTVEDEKATSISTVEAVNLVSTEWDPFRGKPSVIDSDASLINVNGKKLNGKYSTDNEETPTFVCICTTLFPSRSGTTSLPQVDKHNPHVDWGPLF